MSNNGAFLLYILSPLPFTWPPTTRHWGYTMSWFNRQKRHQHFTRLHFWLPQKKSDFSLQAAITMLYQKMLTNEIIWLLSVYVLLKQTLNNEGSSRDVSHFSKKRGLTYHTLLLAEGAFWLQIFTLPFYTQTSQEKNSIEWTHRVEILEGKCGYFSMDVIKTSFL